MKKLEKLTEKRYNLINKINCVESKIKRTNKKVLLKEAKNLLNKEGEGFIEGDFYAEDRYYSNIQGVKNIRFCENWLEVKITNTDGFLLPETITINRYDFEDTYKIRFFYSKDFDIDIESFAKEFDCPFPVIEELMIKGYLKDI